MKLKPSVLGMMLIACLVGSLPHPGWAQDASAQVDRTLARAGGFCSRQPDSALLLLDSCLHWARQQQRFDIQSRAHYLAGVAHKNKSEYPASEAAHSEALTTARMAGDSLLVADALFGQGTLKRHQGEYPQSLSLLNRALTLRQNHEASDTELARTYNSIGAVLHTIGKSEQAIDYFRKSLHIHQRTPGRERFVASSAANIGGLFVANQQADSAIKYLRISLDLFEGMEHILGIGAASINLAEAYLLLQQADKAAPFAQKSLEAFRKVSDRAREGMALNTLAGIEADQGNIGQAIAYATESLNIARQVQRRDNMRDQYQRLSELYAQNQDWTAAYEAQRHYSALKDSLFDESADARLQEEQQRFETQVKDREIEYLKTQEETRRRVQRGLMVGLLVLVVLLSLVARAWYTRRRLSRQLQAEQQTTRELLQSKETLLEELQATQIQLIEREKMASIGHLTAGIAHEINNPLNFMTSHIMGLRLDFEEIQQLLAKVEALKNNPEPEKELPELLALSDRLDSAYLRAEISQLIKGMERGANRTKEIVQGLMIFSRNTTEQFIPASVEEGIESTLTLMRGNVPEEIAIETDFGGVPSIPCQISRLNQVFLNLLTNAVQAIGEEQGRIWIQTRLANQEVYIRISDNGAGMEAAVRKQAFDPFFTTKPPGSGTGLGLSISYGIIEQHQGRIEVESQPGEGTTFTVVLPVDRADT